MDETGEKAMREFSFSPFGGFNKCEMNSFCEHIKEKLSFFSSQNFSSPISSLFSAVSFHFQESTNSTHFLFTDFISVHQPFLKFQWESFLLDKLQIQIFQPNSNSRE
eukprot:Sdes_comp18053_c0_seq2m7421